MNHPCPFCRASLLIVVFFLVVIGEAGAQHEQKNLTEMLRELSRDLAGEDALWFRSNQLLVLGEAIDPAEQDPLSGPFALRYQFPLNSFPESWGEVPGEPPYVVRLLFLMASIPADPAVPAAGYESALLELYSQPSAGSAPGPSPGAPLLRWPEVQGTRQAISLRQIAYRFFFDSEGNWIRTLRYFYRADGRLYERLLIDERGIQRFRVLEEGDRGTIEVLALGEGEENSYRRFDNQGRLIGQSGGNQTLSINYGEDGTRSEREALPDGGSEIREYDAENRILRSETRYDDGVLETRDFRYDGDGRIIAEAFSGPLGEVATEYRYENGDLAEIETIRDGVRISLQQIDGSGRTETRYLRGEPVLRIRFEDGARIYEEELVDGEVIRRRDYREESE
jgi:hypothetical protein